MEKGGGGSRLLQMQARFQQKQLQEREMKIASLYEAQQARALDRVRHSPSNTSNVSNGVSIVSSPPQPAVVSHGPGKVRQMFEERRTKGIDKSYPLQPIHNTDRGTRKALPNGYTKVTTSSSNSRVITEKRSTKTVTSTHSVKKQHKLENIVNCSGDLNHNHEQDFNHSKPMLSQSNGEIIHSIDEADKVDNNYLIEDETFPDALAPTPTPRSPEPPNNDKRDAVDVENVRISPETVKLTNGVAKTKAEPVKSVRKSPSRVKTSPTKSRPQPVATPPRRATSENAVTECSKARGAMQRSANPVQRRHPVGSGGASSVSKARSTASPGVAASPTSAASGGGSGPSCGVCGRHFAPDRIAKHQEICKKAHAKKRKPFDVLKHRLAGTEAEPFIGKLRKSTTNPSTTKVSSKPLNSNWRQKHEEFINAIRAAKQVQAHLNAGGKLSDLPPPPPSENPDYIQCPHCNRRFNQSAAERHIPKCANFQFNKPKPAAKKR